MIYQNLDDAKTPKKDFSTTRQESVSRARMSRDPFSLRITPLPVHDPGGKLPFLRDFAILVVVFHTRGDITQIFAHHLDLPAEE